MRLDGGEPSNFGTFVVGVVNAITARCASDGVGVSFLRAVGRYNSKVCCFLVFGYLVERDEHNCVGS